MPRLKKKQATEVQGKQRVIAKVRLQKSIQRGRSATIGQNSNHYHLNIQKCVQKTLGWAGRWPTRTRGPYQ